jgi:hypothetical protein
MNWPGPLEGAVTEARGVIASWLQLEIDEWLDRETIEITDLYGLINANELFKLSPDVVGRIVEQIRQSGPPLFPDILAPEAQDGLVRLANLAASNRQTELANQVRSLARHRRRTAGANVSIENDLYLAFSASAACAEPGEWRDAFGSWVTELAVDATDDAADSLMNWLDRACEIDPALCSFMGRSRAALNLTSSGAPRAVAR